MNSEDTQHSSARRQSADNVYLSANSLVLGAVAFLVAQGALHSAMMLGALLALAFAGDRNSKIALSQTAKCGLSPCPIRDAETVGS